MVGNSNHSYNSNNTIPFETSNFKWCSVLLSDVFEKKMRFEASAFDIEGKHARQILKNSKYPLFPFTGTNGLSNIYHRPRFKRIYVDKSDLPIFQPSQITEVYPKPDTFISAQTKTDIEQLRVHKNQILLTCSGTIGSCTIVGDTLDNCIFSHDLIRIDANDERDIGYLYAFLKTKIGQTIIRTNNYGAVIQHIEPEHLTQLPVPKPDHLIRNNIHHKIKRSFELRDESNDLIDKAKTTLIEELKLPAIESFKPKYLQSKESLRSFSNKASKLFGRFEATYHTPIVSEILNHLKKYAKEITTLGDSRISKQIMLPGRFKRVYVDEGQGVVFFGGKELLQLDPSNDKFLSLSHHGDRIKDELLINKNTILISRSGTIGKVAIVPEHWSSWIASEHIIRIIPVDQSLAGYIYTWLETDYGYELIKRFSYGAVVDEIDDKHVSRIEIPILNDEKKQTDINDHILEANQKRYEAYILEQEAIKMVNELVIYTR